MRPCERMYQIAELLDSEVRVGVEVGVYTAMCSTYWLRTFPNLHMILVDPWKPYDGGWDKTGNKTIEEFEEIKRQALINISEFGPRYWVIAKESQIACQHVADGSIDFGFVDGNHLYEFVKIDIHCWWPKIRPNGFISGHDYYERQPGVMQAVDEFVLSRKLQLFTGRDSTWWIYKDESLHFPEDAADN